MTISDAAVIAAGSAFYGPVWRDIVEERASGFEHAISQVRSMLEAAAPFIRAQALEEAADEIDAQRDAANPDRKPDEDWSVIDHRAGRFLGKTVAARLLRARAAGMRQG